MRGKDEDEDEDEGKEAANSRETALITYELLALEPKLTFADRAHEDR